MSIINPFEKKGKVQPRKRDFLIVAVISFSLLIAIIYYTYIYKFPIVSEDFPTIKITYQGDLNTEDYVDGTFELESPDDSEDISTKNCKIKIRGSLNADMPKKGYRIELAEQISLMGMRKDDDWQLFAMYMDLTDMRIKLAFDLWGRLLQTDPTAILPQSEYVILYLNGDFQGLYLLAEKNDRRLFGLDDAQNNAYSSLIFQSNVHNFNFLEYSDDCWDQDWPNEYDGIYIKDDIFSELIPFISQTSDSEFFNDSIGIFTKFDKQNLIDFYIFNYFILHKDFWSNNYFLVRNTYPNKFFLIPWDFDSSFGQYLGRKYSSDENLEFEIFKRNYLFVRLMNNGEFREAVKERWFFLRELIWSEESIIDMLSEIYYDIKNMIEIDNDKWYPWYYDIKWSLKTDEAVEEFFDWIPERLIFCDLYFQSF